MSNNDMVNWFGFAVGTLGMIEVIASAADGWSGPIVLVLTLTVGLAG